MNYRFFIILLFILFISRLEVNCQETRYDYKTLTINELFSKYISTDNKEEMNQLEELLDDSITFYYEYVCKAIEIIDSLEENIEVRFEFDLSKNTNEYSIKERNVYFFVITREDSIFAKNEFTDRIDTLDNSIKNFITNPENDYFLPEKYFKYITNFDSVEITKHGFFIDCLILPDSLNRRTSWNTIHKTVRLIMKSYNDLRNELSQKKWNSEFSDLSFEKKVSVVMYYRINILIFMNRQRLVKIPPIPENVDVFEFMNIEIDDD